MADLIVVLDGRRVAQVGSHEELMASGGPYAEVYGLQASAYRSVRGGSGPRCGPPLT
jgi:ATP-binding cassette subfamily B protein